MVEFQLVSTHHDGNQLGSLPYLLGVRIEKRRSEKPINLTEQLLIYRTLLDNLLEFKKEDFVIVAIKFDIEIATVVNTLLKCKVASILSPYVQVRKSKLEKRNKHIEADQKQQVVDCGTKRACKTDAIAGA